MSKNENHEFEPARLIVAAVLLAAVTAFDRIPSTRNWLQDSGTLAPYIRFALYLVPYLIVGFPVLKEAVSGLIHGELLDENFLMTVATAGAFILGEYPEAVFVMLFSQTGEFFEDFAEGRSRKSIAGLLNLRPETASVDAAGVITEKKLEDVHPGDIILVRPGEKIPADGEIIEGRTTIDTAALTGESVPREAASGSIVLSGCLNLTGFIKLRVTKEADESTVARILELVENAGERKARAEKFITRFARIYTPAVICTAVLIAILPPLMLNASWRKWIYRALSFLVISCPCALVISIPLGFFGGIGAASRKGILFKGSNFVDALSRLETAVFDKTGTLTKGTFCVQAVHGKNSELLLELAALAESRSAHPLAKTVVDAWMKADGEMPRIIDGKRIGSVTETAGQGISAIIDGHSVLCGNEKLLAAEGIMTEHCGLCQTLEESGNEVWTPTVAGPLAGTVIHVSCDGEYLGHIIVSDILKPSAGSALRKLKDLGVKKAVLLTGDNASAAEAVARMTGIDEVKSGLLPQDKVTCLEEIMNGNKSAGRETGTTAFTGDGINDAPVLMRADIGIAMGAFGSDAAIEAADVVIMDDDPAKVALSVLIARKTLRIVKENIWFALFVKGAILVLSATGVTGLWAAVFADVGVSMLAILNSLRAGR